jgi:hypothetical protein
MLKVNKALPKTYREGYPTSLLPLQEQHGQLRSAPSDSDVHKSLTELREEVEEETKVYDARQSIKLDVRTSSQLIL